MLFATGRLTSVRNGRAIARARRGSLSIIVSMRRSAIVIVGVGCLNNACSARCVDGGRARRHREIGSGWGPFRIRYHEKNRGYGARTDRPILVGHASPLRVRTRMRVLRAHHTFGPNMDRALAGRALLPRGDLLASRRAHLLPSRAPRTVLGPGTPVECSPWWWSPLGAVTPASRP